MARLVPYTSCIHIDHIQGVCLCEQLFTCYAKPAKDKALLKQRLSHWIVDATSLAYTSNGFQLAHSVSV